MSISMKNNKNNNVNRIIDYSVILDSTDILAGASIIEIESISQGCEFNILTDKNINSNKNSINITTKLIEHSTSNIIDINYTLILSNNNIIKCKSNQE